MKTAGLAILTIVLVVVAVFVINKSIKSHTPPPPDAQIMQQGQGPRVPGGMGDAATTVTQ